MLPRHLVALSFSLIFESLAYAAQPQSFLSEAAVRKDQVQNVLEHEPVKEAVCEKHVSNVAPFAVRCLLIRLKLTGPIETTLCDYESIESVNDELFKELHSLVETPFFKYFRVRRPVHFPEFFMVSSLINRLISIEIVHSGRRMACVLIENAGLQP